MCTLVTKYSNSNMNINEFYEKLSYVNASRANRLANAAFVKNNMQLFPALLQIMFKAEGKVSCHAAWVFEFVCLDNVKILLPHVDYFIANIDTVYMDAIVRPVSKVCALLMQDYNTDKAANLKTVLTQKHKEQLTETAFSWLIGTHKVAAKVHAMETLFLLGLAPRFKWIHAELMQVLQQDFTTQSAAYKSRAKSIFKRLQKYPKTI